MNVILLGPPGAGKGTQARLLRDRHHLMLIATGDILRGEIERKTPLGLQIKDIMDSGRFPSDEIILKIFEECLDKGKGQGVVLDGLPRTLNQAQKIDEIFGRRSLALDAVIQIATDDVEVIKRLSSRTVCKTCGATYTADLPPLLEGECDKCAGHDFVRRPDDSPDVVKTRLDVYNEQTRPLLDYYSKNSRLKVVNGMKAVEKVSADIESLLGACKY